MIKYATNCKLIVQPGKAVQCSLVKYLDLITAEYLMNETYG